MVIYENQTTPKTNVNKNLREKINYSLFVFCFFLKNTFLTLWRNCLAFGFFVTQQW